MNGLWTRSLLLDTPTYAPASHTVAFTLQYSPAGQPLTNFSSEYHQVLIATHLHTPEGRGWAPGCSC